MSRPDLDESAIAAVIEVLRSGRLALGPRARHGESVDYTYDRFGRVTQDGQLLYQYDRNGNRIEVEYPGGVKAVYTHDFADREATLTLQQPGEPDRPIVTASAYEPSGPLASLSLGNGLTETRTFTSRYFPESIELSGGSTLFDWTYTQDNEGNVLAITDGVSPAGNRSYTYQDHQYFLTAGVGPWGGITWTYDQIGNRLTEQRGALTDVYLYDQNAATGNTPLLDSVALGVGGTRDYTYGMAGHVEQVTADINETFFENAADSRLTRLERPAGDAATDFLYDGRSFLTRSIERSYQNLLTDGFEFGHTDCWTQLEGGVLGPQGPECFQQVTRPVYSSEGVLHALLKTNGPATTLESHYLLYFAGRPVLQLAVDAQGGSTYGYLTTDHLGTPAALCDETGTLLWQGGFEPFGADSYSGADGAGVYLRFPGQWVDGTWEGSANSNFTYNLHRWYEYSKGRYSRADPVDRISVAYSALLLVSPDHPYSYVQQRPLSLVDSLGLRSDNPVECVTRWVATGAAAGAVVGAGVGAAAGGAVGAAAGGTVAGAACTPVAPGVGTVGCGTVGAAAGGAAGATGGGFTGAVKGVIAGGLGGGLVGVLVCTCDVSWVFRRDNPSDGVDCRRIKLFCIEKCIQETLPTGTFDGAPFFKCLKECLNSFGC